MTYRTMLVHVDQSLHARRRIQCAIELARRFDAHLVGVAVTGVSRFLLPGSVEMGGEMLAEQIGIMKTSALQALDTFDAIVTASGLSKHERRYVNDDYDGGLALQMLYADLLVISQTDPADDQLGNPGDLPEYMLANSVRPILLIPSAAGHEHIGTQVVIGWNGSLEAARAIGCALPLLKLAAKVTVMVLNPAADADVHGATPGADIALYLARHGVNVDVLAQSCDTDVGTALLDAASKLHADLLVIGGYGHSRWREMLLGGVTRTVLLKMRLPVLMAH